MCKLGLLFNNNYPRYSSGLRFASQGTMIRVPTELWRVAIQLGKKIKKLSLLAFYDLCVSI